MAKQFPKNLYARVYDRCREVRELVKSERAATIDNAAHVVHAAEYEAEQDASERRAESLVRSGRTLRPATFC